MGFLPSWNGINDIVIPLAYTPPLDGRSDVACAYSFSRKLKTAYAGPAFKVLRSTDSAQFDIYFGANGTVSAATLNALSNGGNLAIVTLYDQSGNNRHLSANIAYQCYIVKAGVTQTINSLPSALFQSTCDLMSSGFVAFTGGFTAVLAACGTNPGATTAFSKASNTDTSGCGPSYYSYGGSPFFYASENLYISNNNYGTNTATSQTHGISEQPAQSYLPIGAAIDSSGNIWCTNYFNKIMKFNSSGVWQASYGGPGSANGLFNTPNAITFDASGNIWICDSYNSRIQKFDSSFNWLQTIGGTYGSGNNQFSEPFGMCFDSVGNFYVADTYNQRIQKFNSAGVYQATIGGTYGSANNQLAYPFDVTIDASDNLFIADTYNYRIQKFNSSLVYQSTIAEGYGTGTSQTTGDYKIYVDKATGNIITSQNSVIRIRNSSGTVVASIGTGTSGASNTQVNQPRQFAKDASGNFLFADYGNSRLQLFNSSFAYSTSYGNNFPLSLNLYSFECNSSTKATTTFYNGANNGTSTASVYGDVGSTQLILGGQWLPNGAGDLFDGYISESIFLNTDLSPTNRAALEANLKAFYGTP